MRDLHFYFFLLHFRGHVIRFSKKDQNGQIEVFPCHHSPMGTKHGDEGQVWDRWWCAEMALGVRVKGGQLALK